MPEPNNDSVAFRYLREEVARQMANVYKIFEDAKTKEAIKLACKDSLNTQRISYEKTQGLNTIS